MIRWGRVASEVSLLLWQVSLRAGKGDMAWEGRVQELREGSTKKPGEGSIAREAGCSDLGNAGHRNLEGQLLGTSGG